MHPFPFLYPAPPPTPSLTSPLPLVFLLYLTDCDPLFRLLRLCSSKHRGLVPLPAEWKCLLLSLEMASPEVMVSSCSSRQDENPCTFHASSSPSEQLLLEDQMRRKLKFFFMNPCEKFWARGRKPWKLAIQILKIAMVTIQVSIFQHELSWTGSSNNF